MSYAFGKRSRENLMTAHPLLVMLCEKVIQGSMDFSVIEGHRSLERQKELFDDGKSQIDGINQKGNHNYEPSLAVDVIPYKKGQNPFDGTDRAELDFYRLHREFEIAANELDIDIVWGGNWTTLDDKPHYELGTIN